MTICLSINVPNMIYAGSSSLDPIAVLSKIPPGTHIPNLRPRLVRLLLQQRFLQEMHSECSQLLEDDCLQLLRQKNQGQRKAMKIEVVASLRCSLCSRLLTIPVTAAPRDGRETTIHRIDGLDKHSIQVWGQGRRKGKLQTADTGIVMLSGKIGFHKVCFESIDSS